ncbi:MAG: sigma-70 family RNA polymerase sigma factor [Chloroflexi bacterium]|nr:sigma-70 family RNA polymerase sigma factor [Chloroflexota bacterium]
MEIRQQVILGSNPIVRRRWKGDRVEQSAGDVAGLIRKAKNLDRAAFAELYRFAVSPVYRYLSVRLNTTQEAEDLTQEVFMAALAGIQGLRAEDEVGLLAWLFQIARHKLADHLRQRYRRPSTPLGETEHLASLDAQPAEVAEAGDERAELRQAFQLLTAEQREVLVYKYVLEMDNERTARIVGKSVNAVNQLHHRALGSLHRLLAKPERVR